MLVRPALLALLALAACGPEPVDGGPCRYDTLSAEATVTAIDTLGVDSYRVTVGLAFPEGRPATTWLGDGEPTETLTVDGPDATPALGARYPASVDVITEGTCTPVIVAVDGLGPTG